MHSAAPHAFPRSRDAKEPRRKLKLWVSIPKYQPLCWPFTLSLGKATHQSWGWSEDDIMIMCAFNKHPHCMMLSERKINITMEFLVKEIDLTVSRRPLLHPREEDYIPRCSVIKVLASKGLVKEDSSLTSLLVPVEKLVIKYEEELPELMDVYRGYTKR